MQTVKLGLEFNIFEFILHRCLPEMSCIAHLVWEEKSKGSRKRKGIPGLFHWCSEAVGVLGRDDNFEEIQISGYCLMFQLSCDSNPAMQAKVILPMELIPCGICRMDNMLSESKPSHPVYRDAKCEKRCRYSGKDSTADAKVSPTHPLSMQRAVCVEQAAVCSSIPHIWALCSSKKQTCSEGKMQLQKLSQNLLTEPFIVIQHFSDTAAAWVES